MPKALKGGFPTYWTTFGQGSRPALAIHCALGHSGGWGALARDLSGLLTMTAFDMPGHGRSGDWDDRGELQGVVAGIAADFLDGPADIIGHSFGATVALRLAVERPDLVRSLTLIEPVFFAVAFVDRPGARAEYEAREADFLAGMEAQDMEAAARAFLRSNGDGTDWEAYSEETRKRFIRQMPVVGAGSPALMEDVGGMLQPGGLDALDCPVLLIEGSASVPIMPDITGGLAARIPQARRAVVLGAGHMVPITHAPQVAAEILRFLREV